MELSALETLWTTPIEELCANDSGYRQMLRLMNINETMRDTLSNNLGNGVLSGVNKVSDEITDYQYSYADSANYIENYQKKTDRESTYTGNVTNYSQNYGKNGKLYGWTENLYPDDNGTGSDVGNTGDLKNGDSFASWNTENKNSILSKTKKLFRCRKINTIISRFYTDNVEGEFNEISESATSLYGMSHGRNLLTYEAERNGNAYSVNGYKNPYCRVWTHHHQYSQLRERLIRPFVDEDGNTMSDVNKWDNFKDMEDGDTKDSTIKKIDFDMSDKVTKSVVNAGKVLYNNNLKIKTYDQKITEKTKWSWRSSTGVDGYKHSVLNHENGFLNITPKFLGGAQKNIHTKDCMFSIENLAWQGYDPYSFEKALSWEQRGPFGGRIMWFPPYGLNFNEDTSVNWNEHSFIGRGENVYTYTNTTRSGTLSFMMVVDHPSIVDYTLWDDNDTSVKDTDILRFFAGCQGTEDESLLKTFAKPTPLTDEYTETDVTDKGIPVKENEPLSPPEVPSDEELEIDFYVFYPNNYSGYYDRTDSNSKVDPIAYLLAGNGAQWKCNINNVKQSQPILISFSNLSENEALLGNGYEMGMSGTDIQEQERNNNFIIGTGYPKGYGKNTYVVNKNKKWYYRIDGKYENGITYKSIKNTFGQTLIDEKDYQDLDNLNLNCDVGAVKKLFTEEKKNDNLYSLSQIAYALSNDWEKSDDSSETANQKIIRLKSGNRFSKTDENIKNLINLFDTNDGSIYSVTEIHAVGYSNSQGANSENEINNERNDFLAQERCSTAIRWFLANYGNGKISVKTESETSVPNVTVDKGEIYDVSGKTAKKWRSARVTLKIKKSGVVNAEEMKQYEESSKSWSKFTGFDKAGTDSQGRQLYINTNEQQANKKNRKWFYDETTKQMVLLEKEYSVNNRFSGVTTDPNGNVLSGKMTANADGSNLNHLRYDQEYYFFKQLKARDPDVFEALTKKLKYFDPAFHSMTPEGFMGRLNFLHQCTRQGDTIGASDQNGMSANNLAFGRPPFCILRLGDFYYQKIVIRNINITYDPLVWDLNQEGVGVVPLIANVSISFNFIGGGDLTGPVRRLQNAMSFNYYANGRLYDNRADRIERKATNWRTMGAMGNGDVDFPSSKFNHVQMAK